jgi:hypothetical protein
MLCAAVFLMFPAQKVGRVDIFVLTSLVLVFAKYVRIPAPIAKLLTILGDVSYPLYLIHWTVIVTLMERTGAHLRFTTGGVYILAAIAAAFLINFLIDRPARRVLYAELIDAPGRTQPSVAPAPRPMVRRLQRACSIARGKVDLRSNLKKLLRLRPYLVDALDFRRRNNRGALTKLFLAGALIGGALWISSGVLRFQAPVAIDSDPPLVGMTYSLLPNDDAMLATGIVVTVPTDQLHRVRAVKAALGSSFYTVPLGATKTLSTGRDITRMQLPAYVSAPKSLLGGLRKYINWPGDQVVGALVALTICSGLALVGALALFRQIIRRRKWWHGGVRSMLAFVGLLERGDPLSGVVA